MTTINTSRLYDSSRETNDDELFSDEQIQRYDADTIRNRYGENWRDYASNIRDVKQADGSIVREYIIEDPSLLKEIQSSVRSNSSTSSSDDEQPISKHKFAQIKAKFEQKSLTQVMASPSSSSIASSQTTTTRRSSTKLSEDFNQQNRRDSVDSLSNTRVNTIPPPPILSSNSSFRRLNSGDEADEEVQHIHQQATRTPLSSIDEVKQQATSNVQYEIIDEDGNPMAIDNVQNLIQMSGVTAREVPQPDGTIVREYVIDDPHVLSKFQSQQQTRVSQEHIPPPPPRMPLKQSNLIRQEPVLAEYQVSAINIQQIRTLQPQRRYEFVTSTGKRIEFIITNIDASEADVHELANAINARLTPSTNSTPQQPYTLPKQWHPAVDLTQREQTASNNSPRPNPYNPAISSAQQQQPPPPPTQGNLTRSASYGALNQGSYPPQQFAPIFAEPIIDWSAIQQQDPHGQVDPQLIRQYITQKHQSGAFQTSAQFLPEQPNSPSKSNQVPYYPYQGQQQHGVQILSNNPHEYNYNQQQMTTGHTRI